MNRHLACLSWVLAALGLFAFAPVRTASAAERPEVRVLFLGDNGHHQPPLRYRQLAPVMAKRNIELTYTDRMDSLNPKTLGEYDVLAIYANTTEISPEQEKALLDFVEQGKGFVPLHCASYCFLNSPKYVALVGAQFKRHGTGVFRTVIAAPDHPVMKGFGGFESWDETYVHDKHNPQDRTVLEYRADESGREPWTWVRTQGKGRVFYTAWGHDERTWANDGFVNLVERGIRWAAGQEPTLAGSFRDRPEITAKRKDVKPFEYVPAKVPFYPPVRRPGATNEPIAEMQKPLDPEESAKHLVTPVGLEPRLFISEPQLQGKPIAMNWDERGRLWICETVDYPNEMQPPGQGRDRIRIIEDTDHDGKADKSTVFADKLSIPTSLIFSRGGVIVFQAPDTLYLKDTDGDDVADVRRVLFSGWSTGDTHAGPSNLRYGLDNWYYAICGYAGFDGQIAGERQTFRTGFLRLHATGANDGVSIDKFEFLRNTSNNSWGVGFSEEGILFGSTANGNPSVYLPIPNRYYEAVRGWSSTVLGTIADSNRFYPVTEKVRQVDYHGGFTAAAGHALYTARAYPKEYWNRTAFVTEPTGHLAATFTLTPQGADFRSHNAWNLVASDDEWTSPVMAEVGPDGHVWVIDWYNYIVQHNPTPVGFRNGKGNAYETDLRDKTHGRIYRLVHTNSPPSAKPPRQTLAGATPSELVAALADDNMFWRLHAQRLLVERGQTDVAAELIGLVTSTAVDEIGLNPGAIHALWTLHGLGLLDDGKNDAALQAAVGALGHPSDGVRRNAVLVLPRTNATVAEIVKRDLINDAAPQVRLAALLTWAECPPTSDAASALVKFLAGGAARGDAWLLDAATCAAARQGATLLEVAAKDGAALGERQAELGRLAIASQHVARSDAAAAIPGLLKELAKADPRVAGTIITGLDKGWPKDAQVKFDGASEEALVQLTGRVAPEVRAQLVALATRWGSTRLESYTREIAVQLLAQVRDAKQADAARVTAARQLVEFRPRDVESVKELLALIGPRTSPELGQGLLDAAALSESAAVGEAVLGALAGATPAVRPTGIRALLRRPEWTRLLIEALDKGSIRLTELTLDQKQSLAAHPDKTLAERAKALLARGGGLPNPDRQKVLEELMPLTRLTGDAAKGKEIYKKQCSKCHVHSGEGTKIGPELTGMAVHPKSELLTHIIDPSRSVEGNYRVYTVVTADGLVLNGLLASETKTTLELFDTEGKRQVLQREDVEELVASAKSLMPEGFEKQATPEELTNLLEFLTQRGKYLPIPLEKVATIVSTRGMFYNADAEAERLIFPDWKPKMVDGVPFVLVDPQVDRVPNVIMLYGPTGNFPPRMPKSVTLPCNSAAKSIHFLSGVSGWGHPFGPEKTVTMIVRLHYANGETEDHSLRNGEHFADYIRRVDVPGSKFAFALRGQQIRYLSVQPKKPDVIASIELVKGNDQTAPVVMAVTVESPETAAKVEPAGK